MIEPHSPPRLARTGEADSLLGIGSETENKFQNFKLTADDIDGISEHLKFDHTVGGDFASFHDNFEQHAAERAQQIREGKLRVIIARQRGRLIGTSVVSLENGVMGKELSSNEAWAAGTLIRQEMRSTGVAFSLAAEQEKIAQESGKDTMRTQVHPDNYGSSRFRMKIGYEMCGITWRRERGDVVYNYRKDLTREPKEKVEWGKKYQDGELQEIQDISDDSPNQILANPLNPALIEKILASGYRGVHLLTPPDYGQTIGSGKNLVVFIKE
ncbi:MAG: MutT-like protein [uncultured bacterium]|nr:MAG: MutT-like protein [uncultured bacterium]